jgi:glyoxylase-like metal-dependent hydrolase (beta-lactamase superfamily II)
VRELAISARTCRVRAGDAILPRISARDAPGHTPGHLVFMLEGQDGDVIFTGDAAKNRAEMLSRSADMTYDPSVSQRSIDSIWTLWKRKPGSVLVPGHDVPMVLSQGEPSYIGARTAAVSSWFGADLEQTTLFQLNVA